MANLQWLPGLHYALTLISKQDTQTTHIAEHQTHIWLYKDYFLPNSTSQNCQPTLSNRNYDYIRHTKRPMLIMAPKITFHQYLELRERFKFHRASFATIDFSMIDFTSNISDRQLIRSISLEDNIISMYLSMNPTIDMNMDLVLADTYFSLNPKTKPETIFEDVEYDEEGDVISVGETKVNYNPTILFRNPNFICFKKHPELISSDHQYSPYIFATNPANTSLNDLGISDSNRLINIYVKDIQDIRDIIIMPKKPDAIYQALINGIFPPSTYARVLNHICYLGSARGFSHIEDHETLLEDRKLVYLYTHPDPVKYDIDRLYNC